MKITQEMKKLYERSLKIPPRTDAKKLLFNSWMNDCTYGQYYFKVIASGERPESPEYYESYITGRDEKCLDFYERYMEAINSI